MIVEMKQLEYFIMCCDYGSFSKAAQVLYTTQPNVSKVICQMEKQLNCKLFVRKGRGISLTETGKKIYKYAVNIMENTESISEILNQEEGKCFAIASVPSNFMTLSFNEWYEEKKNSYLKFRYMEGSLKKVIDYVKKYEADLGFVYLSRQYLDDFNSKILKEELEYVNLSNAIQVVAVGKNNPFYHEKEITPEMLKEIKFIHYQDKSLAVIKDELLMNQVLNDSGNQHKFITNSENVILNLVENTDLALISIGRRCSMEEQQRNIRHIPLVGATNQVSFGYVARKSTYITDDMREFIKKVTG